MGIVYPSEYSTDEERLGYCYILQEALIQLHNEMGVNFQMGKITEVEWQDFLTNYFTPKMEAITEELVQYRLNIKAQFVMIDKEVLDAI